MNPIHQSIALLISLSWLFLKDLLYYILFGSKERLMVCLERRMERGDRGVGKDGTCELKIDVLQPNHLSYMWGQWFHLFIYFIFFNV